MDRHAMNFPDLRLSQNAQFHQAHSPVPLDGGMLQLLNCRNFENHSAISSSIIFYPSHVNNISDVDPDLLDILDL